MAVTKKKHKFGFCYRGISTSSQKPTTAPMNFISVSHRLPSSPTRRAEKGHAGASQTFSLWWWGGNGMAIRQNPHSLPLLPPEKDRVCHPANQHPASPRTMIASAIGQEPYAIDIRLPPGKDCIGKQAMEMEMRESSGPTLATKRNYDSHDRFGRSPVFEGKKTGEKGGRQVARVCTCCGNEKHGPISTYLILSVRGARRHEYR
jgi:hypothetical protein